MSMSPLADDSRNAVIMFGMIVAGLWGCCAAFSPSPPPTAPKQTRAAIAVARPFRAPAPAPAATPARDTRDTRDTPREVQVGELLSLRVPHAVRDAPTYASPPIGYTDPTAMYEVVGTNGNGWLELMNPAEPNELTVWVSLVPAPPTPAPTPTPTPDLLDEKI